MIGGCIHDVAIHNVAIHNVASDILNFFLFYFGRYFELWWRHNDFHFQHYDDYDDRTGLARAPTRPTGCQNQGNRAEPVTIGLRQGEAGKGRPTSLPRKDVRPGI